MHRALTLVAACALLALSGEADAQAAKTPSPLMTELFGAAAGKAKAQACFTRVYAGDHLAAHPKQNVRDMVLLLEKSPDADAGNVLNARVGVHFRRLGSEFETGGGCGIRDDGKAVHCGVDCDGGEIDVEVKDAAAVYVKIPDGARLWDPASDSENAPKKARFGPDDTVFKLTRANLRECLKTLAKQ